jgi:TorA maturation chaperone TorD
VLNHITAAPVRLQIARAYALSRDTVKAKAAYQDFFAESGWAEVPPFYSKGLSHEGETIIASAQDMVRFVVRHSERNIPDPVIWNPRVVMDRED